MLICKYCGTSNPDDNNFCDHCGQRLVFTETDASEPNKYENNPFESIDSETTLPHEPEDLHEEVSDRIRETVTTKTTKTTESQPSETIKRCSRCNGTGKIKEKVPSMFGESFEYKTCPKCHGIGRYIVDENGIHKDIISASPVESSVSATRTQYANQNQTTKQVNFKPVIALVCGLLGYALLFGLLTLPNNKKNGNNNTASETTTIESTTIESTTEATLDPNIEFKEQTYKNLSFEIPTNWITYEIEDTPFAYADSNDPKCIIGGGYSYYDTWSSFETSKSNYIAKLEEQVSNNEIADLEYTDYLVDESNALLVSYKNGSNILFTWIIDGSDGFYWFSSSMNIDQEDEFLPIISYTINSCSLSIPEEPLFDTNCIDYTYENITFDLSDSWDESNLSTDDGFRFEYDGCVIDGSIFLYGEDYKTSYTTDYLDFEQAREKLINEFTDDYNNGYYLSFEYEDVTVDGQQAVKIILQTEDSWVTRWYIDDDYCLFLFFTMVKDEKYKPYIEDIVNSMVIDEKEMSPETADDVLSGIDFSSTPFRGMTFEIPSDWVVLDYTMDPYSSTPEIDFIMYSDSTDSTFLCQIFYTDHVPDDVEDMVDRTVDDMVNVEYYFTKCDGYDVGVITGSLEGMEDYTDVIYYIQTKDSVNMVGFSYPIESEDEYRPYADYFLDSLEIDK